MKTEVYSWRVSPEIKTSLEREARRRKLSLSAVLDMAAQEWLMKSGSEDDDDERQRRLQKAASECFGVLASGDTRRSENAREAVRQRLRRQYGR
jgi:hypothetical protein